MDLLLALLIGALYAGAVYLIMRRHIVKLVVGLALLSHGANLLIFVSAGVRSLPPPIVPEGALAPASAVADPVPQALILTAIVISFAVLAFALILLHRAVHSTGSEDLNDMTVSER